MNEFAELKKAQVLLNYWMADAVAPEEREKAERLVNFVLMDNGNESAILRNLIGEDGMRMIKIKRGGVITDKMEERTAVKTYRRLSPQQVLDIYSAYQRARARAERGGKSRIRNGVPGRIARRFKVSIGTLQNIGNYLTEGKSNWKGGYAPSAYIEARKILRGNSQPTIKQEEKEVEVIKTPKSPKKMRKERGIAPAPRQVVPVGAVWEIRFLGKPLLSFSKAEQGA